MHRNLRRELALAKREHVIFTTAFGQSFSVKGFGNFVSDAIRATVLPSRCKARGVEAVARYLVETAVRRIKSRRLPDRSFEEVERHTRKAD
jgi:hypothetical protein